MEKFKNVSEEDSLKTTPQVEYNPKKLIGFRKFILSENDQKYFDKEYQYMLIKNKYTVNDLLNPNKKVPSSKDVVIEGLKNESTIWNMLDSTIKDRIDSENFRIIASVMSEADIDTIYCEDLKAGIENLLVWEHNFKINYELLNVGLGKYNNINSIGKVTIVFEDELNEMKTKKFKNDFLCKEYQSIRKRYNVRYSSELDEEALKMLGNSSKFLDYFDERTIDEISTDRRFYIRVKVSFTLYDSIIIENQLRGLADLLFYERFVHDKCVNWSTNKYNYFLETEFKIDEIQICFEY